MPKAQALHRGGAALFTRLTHGYRPEWTRRSGLRVTVTDQSITVVCNGFFTGLGVVFANYFWEKAVKKKLEDKKLVDVLVKKKDDDERLKL